MSADAILKLARRFEADLSREAKKNDLTDNDYVMLLSVIRDLGIGSSHPSTRSQAHTLLQCAESIVRAETGRIRGMA